VWLSFLWAGIIGPAARRRIRPIDGQSETLGRIAAAHVIGVEAAAASTRTRGRRSARVTQAMMTMKRIEVAALERARDAQ
jgi:hypothetical protein